MKQSALKDYIKLTAHFKFKNVPSNLFEKFLNESLILTTKEIEALKATYDNSEQNQEIVDMIFNVVFLQEKNFIESQLPEMKHDKTLKIKLNNRLKYLNYLLSLK